MKAKGQRRTGGRRLPTGGFHPIDVHVGGRVRERRVELTMSQQRLAQDIGVTFQQVQKYERGANRIGGSRLFRIARVLSVPVAHFFEGMDAKATAGAPKPAARRAASATTLDPTLDRETQALVRAYYTITDRKVRKRVFEMAKALANFSEAH